MVSAFVVLIFKVNYGRILSAYIRFQTEYENGTYRLIAFLYGIAVGGF